ncbi:hypothetical protein ACSBOB_03345 [Mesorhizobium sp. ASY16-5R]|uniref:hypothetical protein n=1 Tax=Mesorhizobium sp. ASY16-5R TaxID=3445772 RepID=UPI003F9FE752
MPKDRYTSVEEQVEYGLDTIPEDRVVSVPLRDLMYAFQTLGELARFFHQPLHWQSHEDVAEFIGNKNSGALHVIHESYYRRLRDTLPPDIEAAFDTDRFDNPKSPYYYEPKGDQKP